MLYDFLDLDRNNNTPLYEQLYNKIINSINTDKFRKGDKLPSIRRLAEDLNISRTTVETAYEQLCAEGYINNQPKRGFFVEAEHNTNNDSTVIKRNPADNSAIKHQSVIKYDFSSSSIDSQYIDIKFWKRCVKDVLDNHYVISSYGSPQGELALRETLCEYSRNVRGVSANVENILIGAGTQTLLSVLLGICKEAGYGKDIAIEKGFFPQGEQIFSDFGFGLSPLQADKNGIILNDTVKSRIIFVNSSGSNRGSAPIPINKRMEIIRHAENNNAIIIEDDFNGELRYNSKPVPALQGMCSDRVVYIGSFSKLLLPSVRISYMVMPDSLACVYRERCHNYNQTSSKIEQLALAQYIKSGRLERQLRKLRKIYAIKSKLLSDCLNKSFGENSIIEVIETALCVRIKLDSPYSLEELQSRAFGSGIKLGKCREKNGLKYFYLCFSGIETEKIPQAVEYLKNIWS